MPADTVLRESRRRATLALARRRGVPVLTADRAWRLLRLPIKIEVIR